jgi:hypothetical protein
MVVSVVDWLILFPCLCPAVVYRVRTGLVLLGTRFSLFGMWWYGAAICSEVVEVLFVMRCNGYILPQIWDC